jgi:amino acid transporter
MPFGGLSPTYCYKNYIFLFLNIYFMKKLYKFVFIQAYSVIFFLLFWKQNVMAALLQPDTADMIRDRAEDMGDSSGFDVDQGIGDVVGVVIEVFLGLLGIIFIFLIIIAGYNWMTAAGEEEKIRKAKSTISRAIIGLIIIVAAYAITYFVFNNLPGATGEAGGPVYNYP